MNEKRESRRASAAPARRSEVEARIRLEQTHDERRELARNREALSRNERSDVGDLARDHVAERALRRVWLAPRDELVEHHADRVEVRRRSDRLGIEELLGRHVVRRALNAASLRAPQRVDDVRDAEVGDLDAAVFGEEHVARLQIAVHDSLRVRRRERVEHLVERAKHDGQSWKSGAPSLEARAAHELHHEEHRAVGVAPDVEDLDDRGVRELRGRRGLVEQEPLRARAAVLGA